MRGKGNDKAPGRPSVRSQDGPVYLVQHVHRMVDGSEDVKVIGVFRTRASARDATRTLRKEPGFRSAPRGFNIDRYEMGKICWREGFATVPRLPPRPVAGVKRRR